MTVADALHGLEVETVSVGDEAAYLIEQTAVDHLLAAPVDSIVEFLARPVQADFQACKSLVAKVVFPLPLAHGLAGGFKNLQRPHDSLPVVGMDSERRRRIDLLEPLVKRAKPALFYFHLKRLPNVRSLRRPDKQSFGQRLDVETRATATDGFSTPPLNIIDAFHRQPPIRSDVKFFVRIDHINEMVRDAFSVRRGWFCRADVHATIDLLRVRVDNFAADFLGQLQGDFALSHRRGPENDNKLGLHRRWKANVN